MSQVLREREQLVSIPARDIKLEGDLILPPDAKGLVVFVHGSGSSRNSPRNQFVARFLNDHSLATLLFDLLSESEEQVDQLTAHLRFDISFLAQRLHNVIEWLRTDPSMRLMKFGLFGSSTGAAAALVTAAARSDVEAVVSRGGRPDLAKTSLPEVISPTLLIVGGEDDVVIDLNRSALKQLRCTKELKVIPRATHLFEEPGTLEEVARLAADWFERHLEAEPS
jgi:putative phosphoribosyl transferase